MTNNQHSRRKFISTCFRSGSLFFGGLLFLNCRDKKVSANKESEITKESTSEDPCNNLLDISAAEIKKRESLGYVLQSTVPDNSCQNCALYIPPKPDKKCGGCLLFKGPVYAEGHCVQWASVTS
ncbi:high-potential iron-sulfur protein [Kriegella sp. EG-1]|nr:high-potential iron-sulfur protein [Flavobacteriaceae bacterium EG-1]